MDIANIYDLPKGKLNQYKDDPFPDNETLPGTKEFARKFKNQILAQTTPHVLALEGGYGVGKTHFITRFCEYLKKENSEDDKTVEAIYLNLWENDYVADPFSIIAAQIINSLNPGQELQEKITQNAITVTNNLIKFGAKMFTGIEIGNPLPNPKQDKEDVKKFKKTLTEIIAKKGGKVVLVIDELDRCNPDYAVKALESLKHFFDIDGLFVILTTRIEFMDSICAAYYGHPGDIHGEGYIQKFVQSTKQLTRNTQDNYARIIRNILKPSTLPKMSDMNNDIKIERFINTLAKTFFNCELSTRKTIDACNEILLKIKNDSYVFWANKVTYYPEKMIITYLKSKKIIPQNAEEPKVYTEDKEEIDTIEKDDLESLL
jgi:DNA polymerase III delta prime subunit